ncbi:hypothetical protein LX36DRAFT_656809 [Colletotrichum falcatum]|nr:hypothetical protein LX36DRAFT_656809 [Colletotrichum falcatum]
MKFSTVLLAHACMALGTHLQSPFLFRTKKVDRAPCAFPLLGNVARRDEARPDKLRTIPPSGCLKFLIGPAL